MGHRWTVTPVAHEHDILAGGYDDTLGTNCCCSTVTLRCQLVLDSRGTASLVPVNISIMYKHLHHVQYSSIITSKHGACTRMETRHEDILFTSRVCVDHVSRSV